jgi:hypothetical protein
MQMYRYGLVMWCLLGCSIYSEAEYVMDMTNAYCDKLMECGDRAVLTFEGLDTVDACIDEYGYGLEQIGAGCVYVESAGQPCVDAVYSMDCSDVDMTATLPTLCAEVYSECNEEIVLISGS